MDAPAIDLPPIKVFNTLSGRKEDFRPLSPPRVNMYVCGITPYSTSHFGHGMSAIVFDTISRYLDFRGYQVRYVQNFTDIEDRLIARAAELGTTIRALADQHTAEYFEALHALNVLPAYVYPRATGELDKMFDMIAGLVERGYAYVAAGDVYFRVSRDEDYGKLSRRPPDDIAAVARVEADERKEHPADFALWKAAKPGEPSWPSPWGEGRPGWHIECSAMSLRYLDEQIDIHGGGQDLMFPHHENEIAQSESFTGRAPFVKYWIHNALVMFGDTKMSKSLGNVVSLPGALAAHPPEAVRLFVLQSHYRSPLSLTDEGMLAAERGIERLRTALAGDEPQETVHQPSTINHQPDPPVSPASVPQPVERARAAFITAMNDDFNTPGAIAALFDLAREANRQRESGDAASAAAARSTLRELASVLGLRLSPAAGTDLAAAPFVELLLKVRGDLRAARQFALADGIRGDLAGLGIHVEDRPDGTSAWRPGAA